MITTINEWRKLNEGFGERIAIGDLDETVQRTIKRKFNNAYVSNPNLYGYNDAIKDTECELDKIYYNIDTLDVETDGRTIEVAEYLKVSPLDVAKTISGILKSLPKGDVGLYEKKKISKAARKFISDKIEFLISKEGKPRKQAVAMAYSYAEREGLIKEDVQSDATKFNIDIKPGEFDGKPINIWTVNAANDMKFGNWESAMRWLIDLWKSDEDLYYFFRGELSTNDELVIGDQIFAGIDVQDHMKLVSESIINEGHSGEIGPLDNAKTKEEAEVIVRKWIRNDKEEGDGDYKKFRDVKWLGKTTEAQMDRESMKWEDQYVILGEVEGEIWMARSSRS